MEYIEYCLPNAEANYEHMQTINDQIQEISINDQIQEISSREGNETRVHTSYANNNYQILYKQYIKSRDIL